MSITNIPTLVRTTSRHRYHPQTQGKIEHWHQTLKNRILLENYYLPGDLEAQIEAFVEHYNHCRYHESLSNLTPADVYFGRGQTILLERETIKRRTIEQRRLQHPPRADIQIMIPGQANPPLKMINQMCQSLL